MRELLDDPDVDHWTPVPSPFDPAAARRHLERAHEVRAAGTGLHLAITRDGGTPLGEVLIFVRDGAPPDSWEIGYLTGAAHRRQGLAAAAVSALVEAAAATGLRRFVLRIEPANAASTAVATRCGFRLAAGPRQVQESKGRRIELAVWELKL